MKIYHKIFAVLLMISLLGFATCNIVLNRDILKGALEGLEVPKTLTDVQRYTAEVDAALTENLMFGHAWNEMYAYVYNALGKNEENSFTYVRDKNGMMYPGNFWNTLPETAKEYTMRILRLKEATEKNGAKLVVFLFPCLYNEAWSEGYYGIPYADYNFLMEELSSYFRYYGIDYINYQDIFLEEGRTAEELFYKTDHHWRVETAFDAFVILTEHLNEKYGENLDLYYTDKNNYSFETYEDIYIGSQGRDAGVTYVGADDFTLIVPKFDTHYEYGSERSVGYVTAEGDIEDTLIYRGFLDEEDYYSRELYSAYMTGINQYDIITNHLNEEGLKVLFLRDSYSSPFATFFSSYCSKVELYWTLDTEAEVMENAVKTGDYDYVFMGLYADNYSTGLEFFLEDEADTEEVSDE